MTTASSSTVSSARAERARAIDPWGEVPLWLRRYWSPLLVAAIVAGAALRYGTLGAVLAPVGLVVSLFVLPFRVNLVAHALRRVRYPDGVPRRTMRRVRRALLALPGAQLPSRWVIRRWHRTGTEERMSWRAWPGDSLARWQDVRTEAVRTALGASMAEVYEPRPGVIGLHLVYASDKGRVLEVAPQVSMTETDVLRDGVPLGRDRQGELVRLSLDQVHVLVSGIPGSGKSNLLQLIVATAALDPWAEVLIIDAKGLSEMGRWASVAQEVAGDLESAIALLERLEAERRRRAADRRVRGLRVYRPGDVSLIVLVIDELAVLTDPTGVTGAEKQKRLHFARLLTDIARLSRAERIVVAAATQRPAADVVPTGMRDLMGTRVALRCTTREQSEIALGAGAQGIGADATALPVAPGAFLLRGQADEVHRAQAFYLDDEALEAVLGRAVLLRPGVGSDAQDPPRLHVLPGPRRPELAPSTDEREETCR